MTGKPRTWPLATEWVGRDAQVRAQLGHSHRYLSLVQSRVTRIAFLQKTKKTVPCYNGEERNALLDQLSRIYAPGSLSRGNSDLGAKCTPSPIYRAVVCAWRLTDRIRYRSRTEFVQRNRLPPRLQMHPPEQLGLGQLGMRLDGFKVYASRRDRRKRFQDPL
jgi:hypothetical protein